MLQRPDMSQTKLLKQQEGGKVSLYQLREGQFPRLPIPHSSAPSHSTRDHQRQSHALWKQSCQELKIEDWQETHKSSMRTVEFPLLLASKCLVGQHVLKDNRPVGLGTGAPGCLQIDAANGDWGWSEPYKPCHISVAKQGGIKGVRPWIGFCLVSPIAFLSYFLNLVLQSVLEDIFQQLCQLAQALIMGLATPDVRFDLSHPILQCMVRATHQYQNSPVSWLCPS